ncbi:hypothetical protein [Desulfovibrio sp. JC022]|uniref:hypothetical protein n=1 Tax=Desulfovibrio sp. JC022 TaxID=2593642 RepID=UPI0013D263F2|nr:hypothetical protein [Desulfovibrio sp. JC022]
MSSRLQSIQSGKTVKLEIRPDQRSNIDIICKVRKSEIIAEEPIHDNLILLTLRKK